MGPKFTIAIPAYKSTFLAQCINSVLSQTYSNYEVIILNDASPEPVREIVSNYSDERICYYENAVNVGAEKIVDNWNFCLEKARGEYFCVIGDDDMLEKDFLKEYLSLILKYSESDVFHCRSLIINECSEPVYYTPSWPESESVYENIWHRINNFRIQFVGDFMYRTTSLKEQGGFYYLPLAWASDDITSYLLMNSKGVKHTNKPIFNYRENSRTLSNTGNLNIKIDAIRLEHLWYLEFLKKIPIDEIDKICYNNISQNLDKYIRKKRIKTIAASLNGKSLIYQIKTLNQARKKIASSKELLFGYAEYFRSYLFSKK